jgi:hypothetical protein
MFDAPALLCQMRRSAERTRASNSPTPKGFGQVVIGTGVERTDFFFFARTRRQHDDRRVGLLAQFDDEIHAVAVRQTEVENHQVGFAGAGVDQAATQRFRLEHLPAFIFQRGAHEAADLRFIFDQQGNG